jgi:hypothetical protein
LQKSSRETKDLLCSRNIDRPLVDRRGASIVTPGCGRLLDEAVQNGYVDEYGEDEALHIIDNGLAIGVDLPADAGENRV